MHFSPLAKDDASFRAISLLMAQQPTYANVPISRMLELFHAVRLGQAFGAIDDGNRLLAVVLWRELSDELARRCIAERKLPSAELCVDHGEAILITALVALDPSCLEQLSDKFVAHNAGKTVLYERHRPEVGKPAQFKWIDKSGRRMGPDLGTA